MSGWLLGKCTSSRSLLTDLSAFPNDLLTDPSVIVFCCPADGVYGGYVYQHEAFAQMSGNSQPYCTLQADDISCFQIHRSTDK